MINNAYPTILFFSVIVFFGDINAYMNPVIDRGVTNFALYRKNQQKKKVVKKKIIKKVEEKIDTTVINAIFKKFEAVKLERQRLENSKKIWIEEFVKKEMGFLIGLSKSKDSTHQQVLLTALSSKSLCDFVHSAILLNYFQQYLAYNDQIFVNFIKNIKETSSKIQYYKQLEEKLANEWREEKSKLDALRLKK